MELRRLGHMEIATSPMIMGTRQAGRDMWTHIDDAETTRAIRAAMDNGIKTVAAVAVHGKGHSECRG